METSNIILRHLFPIFKKNKTIQSIGQAISKTANTSLLQLWSKVKPIFIEEFKVEETVEVQAFERKELLQYIMDREIQRDSKLQSEIAVILQKLEEKGQKTEKHYSLNNSPIHAGGDVQIGDNHVNTQNINNQGANIGNQTNIGTNEGPIHF